MWNYSPISVLIPLRALPIPLKTLLIPLHINQINSTTYATSLSLSLQARASCFPCKLALANPPREILHLAKSNYSLPIANHDIACSQGCDLNIRTAKLNTQIWRHRKVLGIPIYNNSSIKSHEHAAEQFCVFKYLLQHLRLIACNMSSVWLK